MSQVGRADFCNLAPNNVVYVYEHKTLQAIVSHWQAVLMFLFSVS